MDRFLSSLLDRASDFLGNRPGFLPLLGLSLILLNFLAQLVPGPGAWWVEANALLHLGLVLAILGLLLVRPLS